MIRNLRNDDIDIVMELWKESTMEAQSFIPDEYWLENYDNVKNNYLPNSDMENDSAASIVSPLQLFSLSIRKEEITATMVTSRKQMAMGITRSPNAATK